MGGGQPGLEDPDRRGFHLVLASFLLGIPAETRVRGEHLCWPWKWGRVPSGPPGTSHLATPTPRSSGKEN